MTLLVFLLTVLLSMDGEPASITRTVQQTPGFATMDACIAVGTEAAMTPGVVFWTCTDGGASIDALAADWQHATTGETPVLVLPDVCRTERSDIAFLHTLIICAVP